MKENSLVFATSLLPFSATTLAAHRNPVTCILLGLDRPLTVYAGDHHVEGDIVVIRPGVEHWVEIGGRAKVLYFDALSFPLDAAVAGQLPKYLEKRAMDAFGGDCEAQRELRLLLTTTPARCPPEIAAIVADVAADPMGRMSQAELGQRLGLERTRALRLFKETTGQTFRSFKNWTGLKAAARQIASGEMVRTAAMDAGFADSAHLTRTFRVSFGTTPSQAAATRQP